jgi:hypothetical protein
MIRPVVRRTPAHSSLARLDMAKKTTCPITRADFKANARPVTVKIGDEEIQVPVKFFSTGSLGWYLNKKTEIAVGGVKVPVQIGLNLTIVGSKELPQDATDAPAPPAPATPAPDTAREPPAPPPHAEPAAPAAGPES